MKSLPLLISEEEIQMTMDLAACNYSPENIAKQLELDKKQFMQLWYDKRSDIRQAFDAGKLKAQFNIMNKQRELAESGNITAAQIFLKESREIEVGNIRDRILYGHDVD